jgi:hypothetical protein
MSRKWRRQAPLGETLALLGHKPSSNKPDVGSLGAPATCYVCQRRPNTLPSCSRKRPTNHGGVLIHQDLRPICKGADPHRPGLCHNVLMRASFFFSVQGLVTTLSCLCHPNVHLMGSSAPWRSELIISPCAPILWYLSAGHGPAHQNYALQGLISPRHHSNVNHMSSLNLSNVCMNIPNKSSKSSKTLHRPTIQN